MIRFAAFRVPEVRCWRGAAGPGRGPGPVLRAGSACRYVRDRKWRGLADHTCGSSSHFRPQMGERGRGVGGGVQRWSGCVGGYDGTNKVVQWDALGNGMLQAASLVSCPAWNLQKLEERGGIWEFGIWNQSWIENFEKNLSEQRHAKVHREKAVSKPVARFPIPVCHADHAALKSFARKFAEYKLNLEV